MFLDHEGIIRAGEGRLGKCKAFDYELKNPILLSKNHVLTNLIIHDCHEKVKYLGLTTILRKIRMSGCWIPQARQVVKTPLQNELFV